MPSRIRIAVEGINMRKVRSPIGNVLTLQSKGLLELCHGVEVVDAPLVPWCQRPTAMPIPMAAKSMPSISNSPSHVHVGIEVLRREEEDALEMVP